MSTRALYRLSGLALVLGALLFAIGNLLHPIDHSLESQAKATWRAAHLTFLIGSVIMALGLPGIYLRQAARAGRLGLIGFGAVFFGLLGIVPGAWYEAFVVKAVSEQTADAIEGGAGGTFNGLVAIFFLVGPFLFGIATLRARVLARGAAFVTMAATLGLVVGASGALPTTPEGVTLIACTVLYAAGFAWWGLNLATAPGGEPAIVPAVGGVPQHQPETARLATGD